MTDLREALNLPIIGGEIIANHYPTGSFDYATCQNRTRDDYHWYLEFIINGPNARYNRGEARLNVNAVNKLISALEEASDKMTSLQQQSFSGTFSKQIGELYNPRIELKAENSIVYVNFWVDSGKWQFSRKLDYGQIKTIIEKLKNVEEQGKRMVETLITLDIPNKIPDKIPDGNQIQESPDTRYKEEKASFDRLSVKKQRHLNRNGSLSILQIIRIIKLFFRFLK
jgi:hypothetical protein